MKEVNSHIYKNKDKYPKVELKDLPVIVAKEDDKFSATEIRKSAEYMTSGKWIPSIISKEDKQTIIDIVTPQEEPSIEDKMLDAVDEVFESFFPKKTKIIKEGSSGTPISATSAISSKDRAELVDLYKDLRNSIDIGKFNIDFQQDRIYITRIMDSQMGFDYTPYQKNLPEAVEQEKFNYTPYIASILEYMLDQKMNIQPLPEVKIRYDEDQANDFFGKTAYYDPNNKEVILYVMNRHPKDVCRSFSHEMIHHMQNMEGRLEGLAGTTNTNEDDYLQEIEKEAYLTGNITFRNWEDGLKNNNKEVMAEGRYDKLSNIVSSDIFTAWKEGFEQGKIVIDYNESYDALGDSFDVDAKMLLIKGYGKMEVHEDTGAGTDDGGDYIIVRVIIDPEMLPELWSEISMTLKDVVRHEVEHLTHQGGGFTANSAKIMRSDQARRDKIKAGEIPINQYFKLKKK